MSQTSIVSFFSKHKAQPKRNYQDIVDQLLREAEEAFEAKKFKVSAKKTTEDHQSQGSKPKMSYKKYTLRQKETILQLVPHISFAELERRYGVDESTARLWVKNGVKEDGRKSNGKAPTAAEFEEKLIKRLYVMLDKGIPLTSRTIFQEAKCCYMEDYGLLNQDYELLQNYAKFCAKKGTPSASILQKTSTEEVESFDQKEKEVFLSSQDRLALRDAFLRIKQALVIIDSNWLSRFTTRNHLSYRKITHLSIKSPSELETDIVTFLEDIHSLRREFNIPPELIINFDESAVYYDTLPIYSYFPVGTQHPHLKVTKTHKKRFTAGLGVSAAGEKLNPILIFQGKGERFNNLTNTQGYVMRKNQSAWMTSSLFKNYLKSEIKLFLLRQRQNEDLNGRKGLLIFDRFSGHKLDETEKKALEEEYNVLIRYIPAYTTAMLQPLDLNVNGLIKRSMRNSWMDWFCKDTNLPKKQTIYRWFSQAWKSVTPLNIIKSFLMSGISSDVQGQEDLLSSNLVLLRKKSLRTMEIIIEEEEKDLKEYFSDPYDKPENLFGNDDEVEQQYFFEEPPPAQQDDSQTASKGDKGDEPLQFPLKKAFTGKNVQNEKDNVLEMNLKLAEHFVEK